MMINDKREYILIMKCTNVQYHYNYFLLPVLISARSSNCFNLRFISFKMFFFPRWIKLL